MTVFLRLLYFAITVLFIFFSGCTRNTKIVAEKNYSHLFRKDSMDTDAIIKALNRKTQFTYYTAKGHVSLRDERDDLESGVQLHVVHDSALTVLSKKLGIEIARILITRDTFKLIDRIEKTYTSGHLDEIKLWNLLPLKQPFLQDVLTKGFHLPHYMQYKIESTDKEFQIIGSSESESIKLTGNPFNLLPIHFSWKLQEHTMDVTMENYLLVNNKLFPGTFQIRLFENKEIKIEAQLSWNHIDNKPIQKLNFNIPNHYSLKLK